MSAAVALSDTENDRIKMGGNNPPAFEAHKVNIEDIRAEAMDWLDGKAVESAEEAEGLNTLLDMARKAQKAADDARAAEKKPHLDAGKAVDAQWKPLIDAAQRIVDGCKKALTPWNIKEAERKAEIARKAAEEAEAQRQAEVEATRAASATGALTDAEQADQQAEAAKQADKIAKAAQKAATSGLGLRTTYRPELTDPKAAVAHYWATRREDFIALVNDLAAKDVRAGKREIPGFTIIEEKKAF